MVSDNERQSDKQGRKKLFQVQELHIRTPSNYKKKKWKIQLYTEDWCLIEIPRIRKPKYENCFYDLPGVLLD